VIEYIYDANSEVIWKNQEQSMQRQFWRAIKIDGAFWFRGSQPCITLYVSPF